MKKIAIISDSTCDLPNSIIKERNIICVPLKVCFDGVEYKDGVEMTPTQLFQKYDETGKLPKSSAATINEFFDLFTEKLNEYEDIIYMGIGSKLSSSYQNAIVAKNNFSDELASRIHVLDSANLSTGIGLQILKACDFRDAGMDVNEIIDRLTKITPCVRAQFSVKELTFLHKGGRCSGTKKFFGTMLRIRPILRIIDGVIILADKVFGKYDKALDLQIDDLVSNIDEIDKDYLFITHTLGDHEDEYVLNNIPEKIKSLFKNVIVSDAGCVISTHCGKNTIGILYIKTNKVTK